MAVLSVEAYSEQGDVLKVIKVIKKLSHDTELSVKITLIRLIPKIASFCSEYDSPLVSLKPLIVSEFLTLALQAISDEDMASNIRIRKEGYRVLRYLISENFVTLEDIREKVCTLYNSLMENPGTCFTVVAAGNFLSRMPPVVGEELTETILVPRITELCSNKYAKVREASVHFLVDLSCFVNSIITENIIIPHYIKLCQDEFWYVRRACAETIIMLACTSLLETRKTVLARAFVELLHDADSNVTAVAYQQLGPFITTFAQPSITALASTINGDLLLVHNGEFFFELQSRRILYRFYDQDKFENQYELQPIYSDNNEMDADNVVEVVVVPVSSVTGQQPSENLDELGAAGNEEGSSSSQYKVVNNYENQPDLIQSCIVKNTKMRYTSLSNNESSDSGDSGPKADDDKYSSFQYWRDPLPEVDEQDINLMNGKRKDKTVNDTAEMALKSTERKEKSFFSERYCAPPSSSYCSNKMADLSSDFKNSMRIMKSSYSFSENTDAWCRPANYGFNSLIVPDLSDTFCTSSPKSRFSSSLPKQTVVPQYILDAYSLMAESQISDIRRHCAFTFPAVLMTLGALNWPHLKPLYTELANDTEWKLKQTIANSLHEVAAIIGPDLATQDLIPIFHILINDSEDVRITTLQHLSQFVKLLKPSGRNSFLPRLMEFTITEYAWNWRFRENLSEQLAEILDYYTESDCWNYVSPVAFSLLMDKVAAVRIKALHLMVNLIRVMGADVSLLRSTIAELAEQFAHSTQWNRRQTFVFLCSLLLKYSALPLDMFARDILPHLLDLSWDPVPNIRIAVARSLAYDVIAQSYFNNPVSPHYEVLLQVLKRLNIDKDRDVRFYASCLPTSVQSMTFVKDVE